MLHDHSSSTGNIKLLNHKLDKPFFSNWVVKGQIEKISSLNERYSIINVIFLDKDGNIFLDKDGNILNSSSTKIEILKLEK